MSAGAAAGDDGARCRGPGRLPSGGLILYGAPMRALLLVAALVALSAPLAGLASDLAGRASVIDGDTLEIHGQRIRLHGIDAPESGQQCRTSGERWRCGQQAALALADRIGTAPVRCEQRDVDRYERIVAVCYLGELDLNGWLVSEGWALAYRRYSLDYTGAEDGARAAGRGIWRGDFVAPWEWRRGQRLAGEAANDNDPGDCRIKGNINRDGERTYHVPGSRWYDRTKIDPSKGERWFCTEAEARAAGWRAPRQ